MCHCPVTFLIQRRLTLDLRFACENGGRVQVRPGFLQEDGKAISRNSGGSNARGRDVSSASVLPHDSSWISQVLPGQEVLPPQGSVLSQEADVYDMYFYATRAVLGIRKDSEITWSRIVIPFHKIKKQKGPYEYKMMKEPLMDKVAQVPRFRLKKKRCSG